MDWIVAGLGIMLPFALAVLGGLCAFVGSGKKAQSPRFFLGLSAGVMLSTSVWSLLLPAMERARGTWGNGVLSISAGFISGFFILRGIDLFVSALSNEESGRKSRSGRPFLLMLAMALHNIPEGITLGLAFSLVEKTPSEAAAVGTAMLLAAGIAIQNFPETAAVVFALEEKEVARKRAFLCSVITALVEPVAAVLAVFLAEPIAPFLPFLLSYAAGTMIHVTVEELIPGVQRDAKYHIGTFGILCGFLLMMLLDIIL